MSRTKTIGLVLLALIVLVVVAVVVVWKVITKDSTSSNPLTVTPVLDTTVTTTQTIGSAGGNVPLDTTAADVMLTLPADAVAQEETIQLTALASLTGLPTDTELLVGVAAEPSDLQLIQAGELQFTLSDPPTGNLIGFAYRNAGEDFHYVPLRRQGNTVTLPLTGFSGHGVLVIPAYQEPAFVPSGTAAQAEQELALLTQNQLTEEGDLNSDVFTAITEVLRAWYEGSVQPEAKAATTDDAAFDHALREYLAWRVMVVDFYGYDDALAGELSEADRLLGQALNFAVQQASQRCRDNTDVTEAARLMWLARISIIYGIGNEQGIFDRVFQCTNFELTIDSSLDDFGFASSLSASFPVTIHPDTLKLTGSGSASETNVHDEFTTCSSPGVTYTFTVEPTDLKIPTGAAWEVRLPLTITDSGGVTYDCSTEAYEAKIHNSRFWVDGFDAAHQSEMTSINGSSSATFLLTDWEIVNAGGVFAKKVYQRSVEGVEEQTTLQLLHKPL